MELPIKFQEEKQLLFLDQVIVEKLHYIVKYYYYPIKLVSKR